MLRDGRVDLNFEENAAKIHCAGFDGIAACTNVCAWRARKRKNESSFFGTRTSVGRAEYATLIESDGVFTHPDTGMNQMR